MSKSYTPNDRLARKAKEEGFRARSVYKLQELDQKFKLFTHSKTIIDIGAYPGSWLQYIAQVKPQATIVGVDLQTIKPIEGVNVYAADITNPKAMEVIMQTLNVQQFDTIVSDLAPKTSGVKDVDQWRSIELSIAVLQFAQTYLSTHGTVVMKVLRGADFDEFYTSIKPLFAKVHIAIAKASRNSSREVYIVCKGANAQLQNWEPVL